MTTVFYRWLDGDRSKPGGPKKKSTGID